MQLVEESSLVVSFTRSKFTGNQPIRLHLQLQSSSWQKPLKCKDTNKAFTNCRLSNKQSSLIMANIMTRSWGSMPI